MAARSAVNSAMDMAGMKMVNVTTKASTSRVSGAIQKIMESQGWKREMAMKADGGGTQVAVRTGVQG